MALIRVKIHIGDELEDLLRSFGRIQIYRAESQFGNYQEITKANTRPVLEAGQHFYEFEDWQGTEFHWYKWRSYDDASQRTGVWSRPWRGQIPGATYCQLEDVKRVLRSSDADRRIRFSDFYKNLRSCPNNQGSIRLAAVNIGPEYSGHEPFKITFINSRQFEVTCGESYDVVPRIIGQGQTDQDFLSPDRNLFIAQSNWQGVAQEGDYIEFETDSHMSQADAVRFIQDAEIYVDMVLEENLSWLEAKEQELRFTRDSVPKTISRATALYAAFFIYSTIYNQQTISGLPGNIDDLREGLVSRDRQDLSSWATHAQNLIIGYVNKQKKYFNNETGQAVRNGPQWESTESIFDGLGIIGVGEGVKFPEINQLEDRGQMSYAGLLDPSYLMNGGD